MHNHSDKILNGNDTQTHFKNERSSNTHTCMFRLARKAHSAAIIQVDIVFNRTCIKCTVRPNHRSYICINDEQFIRLLPYLCAFSLRSSTTPPTADRVFVCDICVCLICVIFWNTVRSLCFCTVVFFSLHFTFSTLYYFKHTLAFRWSEAKKNCNSFVIVLSLSRLKFSFAVLDKFIFVAQVDCTLCAIELLISFFILFWFSFACCISLRMQTLCTQSTPDGTKCFAVQILHIKLEWDSKRKANRRKSEKEWKSHSDCKLFSEQLNDLTVLVLCIHLYVFKIHICIAWIQQQRKKCEIIIFREISINRVMKCPSQKEPCLQRGFQIYVCSSQLSFFRLGIRFNTFLVYWCIVLALWWDVFGSFSCHIHACNNRALTPSNAFHLYSQNTENLKYDMPSIHLTHQLIKFIPFTHCFISFHFFTSSHRNTVSSTIIWLQSSHSYSIRQKKKKKLSYAKSQLGVSIAFTDSCNQVNYIVGSWKFVTVFFGIIECSTRLMYVILSCCFLSWLLFLFQMHY